MRSPSRSRTSSSSRRRSRPRSARSIAFTNNGAEPHNATLDAGGCNTATLQSNQADGLVFTAAGTYPFHCTVHTQMHGTVTVS